ncbi:GDP-mannose 4,6-dehydratase [Nitrincola alkalilacustris]|uniref:GDP-mannose 4,6-dehydratase n=1 Tax=Nitrincola alkalilacustris TaxID=1571224 RepID=UPI00197D7A70|nr:GDP-mannose 4,6-dehydratase [Nitrincola alkalilacustris]
MSDPSRILITGASGFVGQHLLPALQSAYPQAVLTATGHSRVDGDSPADGNGKVAFKELDITDPRAVSHLIEQLKPDAVIHMAAQSNVPQSFREPERTWQINLQGSLNLFAALREHAPRSLLLQIGSSDMYGTSFKQGGAVTEQHLLQPLNPYAASKAAADLAAYELSQTSDIRVIRARPFNHTGPGQSEAFVVSAFAAQMARAERGELDEINVGDLSAQRDFLHVQDVVSAYTTLLSQAGRFESGECVNISSGRPVSVQQVLDQLLQLASVRVVVKQDPARMRPSDIPFAVGDNTRLSTRTGWVPAITFEQLMSDVLDYWRSATSS